MARTRSEKDYPRNGWVSGTNIKVNEGDELQRLQESFSPFNEARTVTRTQIFSLSAVYPLSVIRDVWSTGVVHNIDEYELSPGSFLESADITRYVPGYPMEIGQGVRADDDAEGNGAHSTRKTGSSGEKGQLGSQWVSVLRV